jgi:hypothetical protein
MPSVVADCPCCGGSQCCDHPSIIFSVYETDCGIAVGDYTLDRWTDPNAPLTPFTPLIEICNSRGVNSECLEMNCYYGLVPCGGGQFAGVMMLCCRNTCNQTLDGGYFICHLATQIGIVGSCAGIINGTGGGQAINAPLTAGNGCNCPGNCNFSFVVSPGP